MRKNILFWSVFFTLAVTGCSFSAHYIQDGATKDKNPQIISPNNVKIYSAAPDGIKYEVIGSISCQTQGDGDSAASMLKAEAASIGANAIINVRLTKMVSWGSQTGITGTAIRILK